MKTDDWIFRWASMLGILAVVGACATVPMPRSKNQVDSLVVIPKLYIDARSSMTEVHYYLDLTLEDIKTQDDKRITIDERSSDYIYLQNIPPGKYLLKNVGTRTTPTTKSYDKYLEVVSGEMTIFPYKLVIQMEDPHYHYWLLELRKEDMGKIHDVLSKDENYKSWTVHELK